MATAAPDATYDPYAEQPSFWRTHADAVWTVAVFVLTVVLTVLSFPPSKTAEFGYAFAVPALYWAYLKPSFRRYALTLLAAQCTAWTIMLAWLHHVTWLGVFLLGPFVGAWVGLWYLAVWWVMRRMIGRQTGIRVLAMFGLAGLWVLIEWTRMWFLTGFPWLPLAASQWQRSAVLQIASYTGAYGVSFVLIAFNVGFAAYAHRLTREKYHRGLRKRSPEFMYALMLLMLPAFYLIGTEMSNQERQPLARVAVVQPAIPQLLKWDPKQSDMIFNVLGSYTATAAKTRPDLILWPEASTPYAVNRAPQVRRWTEELVTKTSTPLLMGSISITGERGDEVWQNAAFVIDPVSGLQTNSYAKQHLVPFGEYMPLPWALGWLRKFQPIGEDATPGELSTPMVISTPSGVLTAGPLICYEDIFPRLARQSVLDGAEFLAVLTNTAWFGEGGAAYQHAAHSVLRAVETRRPVIRCGNSGWSGWIDEFGNIRATMRNKEGSVYFRGTRTFEVTRDARWVGKQSFYAQHGDWFVPVCLVLALLGWAGMAVSRPTEPVGEDEPQDQGLKLFGK